MKRIVWMLLLAALLGTPGRARADHMVFNFTGVDTSHGASVPVSGTFSFSDPVGPMQSGTLTSGPLAGTGYGYYVAPEATLSYTEAGQTHGINLDPPGQIYATMAEYQLSSTWNHLYTNSLTLGDGVTPIFSTDTASIQVPDILSLPYNVPGSFSFQTNTFSASGPLTTFTLWSLNSLPEPGSLALFGSGLAGLLAFGRRGLRRPSLPCLLA